MTLNIDQVSLENRVDALFAAQQGQAVPGYSVGVMLKGQVLLSKGYGMASLEHGRPLSGSTVFRIASVSKQFTVSAVLMLAAQGRLGLNDDIRQHIPELAELPEQVCIEHLMRNTSGLPDFLEMLRLGGVGLDLNFSRARMLALIAQNRHLSFKPGSRFLYCNTNFLLLGVLVERLSGQTLSSYLNEQIFKPLGMQQTQMALATDEIVQRLATPYLQQEGGSYRRAMHGFEQGGEGGMTSSVNDLLLWSRQFEQARLAPADLAAQLGAATELSGGHTSAYARGMECGMFAGLATLGHGGLWPGFKTEFLRIAERELTVVVIANGAHLEPYRMAREVAAEVLGIRPYGAMPVAAESEGLQGEWFSPATADEAEPGLLQLAFKNGKLMATQWGMPFQLVPTGDGRWLPLRGAYEFVLKQLAPDRLEVAVGAGRVMRYERLLKRPELGSDLDGSYLCSDGSTRWTIAGPQVRLSGAVFTDGGSGSLHALPGDVFELQSASYGFKASQLLRPQRQGGGQVSHFFLDTSRNKNLRFDRV
ncbi:serine hydrolase domain-containing protein [Roseateles oligotrophus]|uniref:Beta-lactamase family protein n=1 Tax=Roseateles oligotrophus TaxID=1769250 RepID=A0ABT2YJ85_9BURK|nr:serine hydrolase domain-containing protein [Roseateles oligotrophus]MCV2370062.1 beta-lactamase family protein [Roseateles oligotrophus]